MAGRKPKPDALHRLAGNPGKRKRDTRAGSGPVLAPDAGHVQIPTAVRDDEMALAEWHRMAPQLELLGLLSSVDQQTFAGYCLAWSMFVRSSKQLRDEGFTYKTDTGQIKKHPAFEVYRACGAEMRKFAIEHGITPSSRTKVTPHSQMELPGVPKKPDVPTSPRDDEAERFFSAHRATH